MIDIKPDPETMAWFRLFSRYISKHSAAIFNVLLKTGIFMIPIPEIPIRTATARGQAVNA
ncbi:MAG: hypothetical protein WBN90_10415 [Gammaproteobacteria bacterium]